MWGGGGGEMELFLAVMLERIKERHLVCLKYYHWVQSRINQIYVKRQENAYMNYLSSVNRFLTPPSDLIYAIGSSRIRFKEIVIFSIVVFASIAATL